MAAQNPKVFLITGVSAGFGRAFGKAAAEAGHKVVGTVRKQADVAAFEALAPGVKAVILDVTDFDAIEPTVAKIERELGPVDVLVNNAGYGHEGIFEESSMEDLRRQFEVNVFGAAAMMKAVLPSMRERRTGHIVNVTSMGGFVTFPGVSYYNGSKFALEGISEAVAKEVAGLGVKVTALAPGGFRTDWAGRSMVRAERSIADYDTVFDPVRKRRQEYSGAQAGDPDKAAKALLGIVEAKDPPVHLLLGNDALKLVREKLATLTAEIDAWEKLSASTDFD